MYPDVDEYDPYKQRYLCSVHFPKTGDDALDTHNQTTQTLLRGSRNLLPLTPTQQQNQQDIVPLTPLTAESGPSRALPETQKTPDKLLNLKYQNLRRKHNRYKNKMYVIENELKVRKESKLDLLQANHKVLAELVSLATSGKKPRGRRYSKLLKETALDLYFTSPECYRKLNKLLPFPAASTLDIEKRLLPVAPGINPMFLECFKESLANKDEQFSHCVVIIDEMAIKTHLEYDNIRDKITGMTDLGFDSEPVDLKTKKPKDVLPHNMAKKVLVLLVAGLKYDWKQPVAFWAVNQVSNDILMEAITSSIRELIKIGLNPRALVSDGGFWPFSKKLGVTEDHPYFMLEGKKNLYVFDSCHLLKLARNALLSYKITYKRPTPTPPPKQPTRGPKAPKPPTPEPPEPIPNGNWTCITECVKFDQKQAVRKLSHIKSDHLILSNNQKMRVYLATQVLSNRMSMVLQEYADHLNLPHFSPSSSETIQSTQFQSLSAQYTSVYCSQLNNYFDFFQHGSAENVRRFRSIAVIAMQEPLHRQQYAKCFSR